MPNPFELHGLWFVAFYIAFAVVVIKTLSLVQRLRESPDPAAATLVDAYLIAYLRGGPDEAIHIAILELVDRGVLRAQDGQLWLAAPDGAAHVQNPLERALAEHFATPGPLHHAIDDPRARAETEALHLRLVERGLLPDEAQRRSRRRQLSMCIGLLSLVALLRVADPDRRSDVGFLIVCVVVAALSAVPVVTRRRTAAGDAALDDLRELLQEQSSRPLVAPPAGEAPALLAAVYGTGVLTEVEWPYSSQIFSTERPRDKKDSSGCWGGGCGASDAGDGACGGGSCGGCGGGGCGGCGGCGCGG